MDQRDLKFVGFKLICFYSLQKKFTVFPRVQGLVNILTIYKQIFLFYGLIGRYCTSLKPHYSEISSELICPYESFQLTVKGLVNAF